MNPTGVGGDRSKENENYIDQKQRGDTAPKGVGSDWGEIRWSIRHHPGTTYAETTYAADDEVNKWDRSQSFEGAVKETADEGEYNCFTILPCCE